MIDFVKIKCLGIDSPLWLNHADFDFKQTVSVKTGEVDSSPLRYKFKGLDFSLIPTQLDPNIYNHYIRGSLHKFKNDGLTNADDFTLSDIIQVVNGLKRYHVEPTNAILENIEFGVNITLPIGIDCDYVLRRMISGIHYKFTESNVFTRVVQNKRFWVKIYDKKRQEREGNAKEEGDNILRVEVAVKKMSFFEEKRFENTKIQTLSDLLSPFNLRLLGDELIDRLKSIVIHDERRNEIAHYPIHVQLKIKDWLNSDFWADLTPNQRFREKEAFAEFQKRGNTGNLKNYLINAVSDKWDELLNITPSVDLVIKNGLEAEKVETVSKSGNGFSNKCPILEAEKVETVSSGNGFKSNECPIKINKTFIKDNNNIERGVQGGKPNITNLKVCDNCGVDISHKRPQTLFCSPKCKNDKHNKMRDRRKVKATPSVVEPNHVPKATPSVVEPNHVPRAIHQVVEPFDIMTALAAMAGIKRM